MRFVASEGLDMRQRRQPDRESRSTAGVSTSTSFHIRTRSRRWASWRPGDGVNIEIDVVARYLERLMTKTEE
jgi:hypothetical protein